MPRKSSTKTAENTTQAIADALDTPLNLEWDATAEKLMVSVPELQERMACKLDDTVFTWGTIDNEVKVKLHALKGQKSGAQLATIELAAEDLTYRKIKGEALLRKVGQLTSEMSAQSDFDPIQLLA